jgi:SSS family transporter
MNSHLAAIDVVIVVLYVLGTLALGTWFSRRQKSTKTYFVGDRNVAWWLVLISIVATETSTVTFLSVPGVAFNREGGNLTFLQLSFGYVIGRVLIAWFLLPQYLRGDLLSAYQLLRQRFNPAVQRTASAIFLATRVVADGLRLFLAALLLHQFTGWDEPMSVLVIGAVTVVYTYLGGMEAVIWTDLIQFAVYIAGAVIAGFCMLQQIAGGGEEFVTVGREAGKFTLFNFTTDLTVPYTFWAGLLGGACFTMASHGADQMMVQRYLCSRSLSEARAALTLSGFVVLLQFLLFLLLGVGLFVSWQQGILTLDEGTRNDEVFGLFIVRFLPHGVIGVLIAAVLASSMSSLSSSLNSAAGAFVADFYRPLRPGRDEGHYLLVSRGMTLFWGLTRVAVAVIALGMARDRSVVDQVLKVAGFTTGIILGLFLLGSLPRPVRSRAALLGMVAGFVLVFLVWLPSAFANDPIPAGLRERLGWLPPTWGGLALAWPWYALVGAGSTVAVALLLNRLETNYGPPADRGAKPGLDKVG